MDDCRSNRTGERMNKRRFLARLRYEFDKSMAAGTVAMIAWLFILSISVVSVAAVLVAIVGIQPSGGGQMSFVEAFWQSLLRAIDTGTMASDEGWGFRLLMLAVTIAGVFIVASLIGVILTGLDAKLANLRKGRSLVLEQDHTIIFNWSETIFDVVGQLVIANESRWRPRIVIMADRDKAEMEDEIAAKVPNHRNSRIICRSGDPTDLDDIGIVNPQSCRSVIILSPEAADPDVRVIKTILTLVTDPLRRKAPYRIVAEIRDNAHDEIARAVGGSEVQLVLGDDVVSKIIVRSTRQPGLSAVYTELLDFDGCEIYSAEQPKLEGKAFGEALHLYDVCSLIGLCDEDGNVRLNPPMSTAIGMGCEVLLIAEDDDRIETAPAPQFTSPATRMRRQKPKPRGPERTLLLGWNRRAPTIVRELSRYVPAGSLLTVAADTHDIEKQTANLKLIGTNLRVELKRVNTCARPDIETLDPLSYDHVLLLGYSDTMEPQAADTRTLVTLLYLRSIREAARKAPDVISEIIDVRNVPLAELTEVGDLVVSNKLVSRLLAQASENRRFEEIFRGLFSGGSEIALRPASDYIPLGQALNFHEVVRAASSRGEIAIGYRLFRQENISKDGNPRRAGSLILNPRKSDPISYDADDRLVLLTLGQS
ncbi:MAG: hypothetical protein ABJB40_10295 [Acidobacteriota bacterium]